MSKISLASSATSQYTRPIVFRESFSAEEVPSPWIRLQNCMKLIFQSLLLVEPQQ
ncbi:unnamed protein product [Moneuplotes crassus]|uniref:Uncharacterized protein n=1 Tax=Euplotes crassus TaxID=5936 RepID=A0AAD2CZE2_EUPCR|nr:unnamed protein product [Moneuplotes crassus]